MPLLLQLLPPSVVALRGLLYLQLVQEILGKTLGPRWAQMTIAAAEHLESGVPAPRLFGSGTDVAKFHENATLVSLCAPRPEQRKLAARALRALKQPRHPGVVRAVEAERGRAAVVDGDPGRA